MTSKNEQNLYNIYLITSRSSRNKPFKVKRDFEGFENTPEYLYIKKLSTFLSQFPQIKPKMFFKAPYMLYKDTEYFDLKFYLSQRAIKAYTLYMKQLQEGSPDSLHHMNFIRDSIKYIATFCIENKIQLEDYPTYSLGSTKVWMKEVKNHNISIYAMFYFFNILEIIGSTPADELDLFLSNLLPNLETYTNRYNSSINARKLVNTGFDRINTFIKTHKPS